MIIREMCEQDLEQVAQIEKEIFSVPWSEKSFADACTEPENVYLVCDCDGKIAGYCGMWTVLGEGNITNMAVAEEYRRKGIAAKLMEELLKRGHEKEVTIFFLEVRESNTAARTLYENAGFSQIGIRKRFYERPVENAIVMSKGHQINIER
jgi:ribosomal-protein-alanine N-acetyltransferase